MATLCNHFYSHVNYSVTKIMATTKSKRDFFYSHVNYSVTKIGFWIGKPGRRFYSHVNYSVTKILDNGNTLQSLLQSRKLFSY